MNRGPASAAIARAPAFVFGGGPPPRFGDSHGPHDREIRLGTRPVRSKGWVFSPVTGSRIRTKSSNHDLHTDQGAGISSLRVTWPGNRHQRPSDRELHAATNNFGKGHRAGVDLKSLTISISREKPSPVKSKPALPESLYRRLRHIFRPSLAAAPRRSRAQ